MAYSEDHIALAAEYALGTLDADERTQVETMMAVDSGFGALVQAWEFRLGPLNQMVGLVEPRPVVWENIKAEQRAGGEQPAQSQKLRRRAAISMAAGVERARQAERYAHENDDQEAVRGLIACRVAGTKPEFDRIAVQQQDQCRDGCRRRAATGHHVGAAGIDRDRRG